MFRLIGVGVLAGVAYWVFKLTGHGDGTVLLGGLALVLIMLGVTAERSR